MNATKRFISTVPAWAFVFVALVITLNTIYFVYRFHTPGNEGYNGIFENGQFKITSVSPGSPSDKAGLKAGDIILSINSEPFSRDYGSYHFYKAGDRLNYRISRNKEELVVPVIINSYLEEFPGFFQSIYFIILLLSIGGLYILYKKPTDQAARIFFIYLQLFALMQNARHLHFQEPIATLANIGFIFGGVLSVSALIHFHLLFPAISSIFKRNKLLPHLFYAIGLIVGIIYSTSYIYRIYQPSLIHEELFLFIDTVGVSWMTMAFIIALSIAVYQYISIKKTLARIQLRVVILGSFFALITPMTLAVTNTFFSHSQYPFPFPLDFPQGIGNLIMIACLLIAIFRYRIWGTEIFIRRALLYLIATFIIILSYLILLFLIDHFTHSEASDLTRFIILAVSIIIFLVLRDRIQHLIDRLFHRESYDSATVVSEFEEKLAGIYKFEDLRSGIVRGLDEIFHFKSLVLNLREDELIYEPVCSIGLDQSIMEKKYKVTPEMEERLQKSNIFSPAELDQKLPFPEIYNSELIVPLINENSPFGFFICGHKKSEKSYSMQDIRVLSIIAKRVIALFHTASLYQKDLDRQLMLERERARISQDMHDDVGASLTRISMLSELVKNKPDITGENKVWLGQISDTSRGVMEEMSQIIWALNPKNDNLEGLVAYIRRFAFEYLEATSVTCIFDMPEDLPDRVLNVEVRRNVYLVFREALHNVVKHSGAKKVWINLELNEDGFRIRIKDDGKGFDPGKLKFRGNGLINMKKRMNDIGGEFNIRSAVENGTEIELLLKGD